MWMNVALFAVHTCQYLWGTPDVASICRWGVLGTHVSDSILVGDLSLNQNTLSWCVLGLRYSSFLTVLQHFIKYTTKLQLPFFGSGCAHVTNFLNVLPQQSLLSERLWVWHQQCRDLLYITGILYILVHFRYFYPLAWSHPCTDRSENELQCILYNSRSLPNVIQIGQHMGECQNGGRKTCFWPII